MAVQHVKERVSREADVLGYPNTRPVACVAEQASLSEGNTTGLIDMKHTRRDNQRCHFPVVRMPAAVWGA